MNEHIEHQIIKDKGKPLFVLVPYEKYIKLISEKETGPTIPHDVVELHIMENKSLIRSWREYKRLSQQEVAQKMNITQAAYSQMEKSPAQVNTGKNRICIRNSIRTVTYLSLKTTFKVELHRSGFAMNLKGFLLSPSQQVRISPPCKLLPAFGGCGGDQGVGQFFLRLCGCLILIPISQFQILLQTLHRLSQ
jgi:DNA-binding XRE family transcriptional regulator